MAVIKTLKGQTVVTVVCNIIYADPVEDDPPQHERDTLKEHIHKMASAWRVVAFFVIVFLVPVLLITLPLYARYTLYPARSLALTASDTLDLASIASSFWCQGQRLSSNGTFDAFLLNDEPKPDKRRVRVTKESRVLEIDEEEPTVRILPLLKGSTFSLDVCARWHGGVIIIVRGEENFKSCYYKEDEDWDDIQEKKLKMMHEKADAAFPPAVVHDSEQHANFHPKFRFPEGGSINPPEHKQVLSIDTSDIVTSSFDDEGDNAREVFDKEKSESDFFDNDETWVLNADSRKVETTFRLLDTTTPYAYSSSSTTSTTTENTVVELKDELKTLSHTFPSVNSTEKSPSLFSKQFRSSSSELRNTNKHPAKNSQSKHDVSDDNKTVINNVSGSKIQHDIEEDEDDEVELKNIISIEDVFEVEDANFRERRSLNADQDPHDGSDEEQKLENEEKLRLLHSVNELVDVTAGNSSRSSSEEFMEKCKTTIIYADVRRVFNCSSENLMGKSSWQFRVNVTDNYYFIFSSDNSIEINLMKYYLEVSRVMYKVSNYKDSCNNSSECAFPFSFLGSEAVVLEMAEPTLANNNQVSDTTENYEVQAVCQPRVAVYLVFILMVPFIILLFAFQ
ncbi:protein of unknown function DUF4793 [Trinorchestia longiramus]|nr:protein of unknown function DUF4793 [Trinorchestia longiramus]